MQSVFDFGRGPGAHPNALTVWPPDARSLAADWQPFWQSFARSPVGQSLMQRVDGRLGNGALIQPPDPLRIFRMLSLAQVRVVILGQDPYHGPHQAQGVAFSVPEGITIPPSLRNIFKEIQRESQVSPPAPAPASSPSPLFLSGQLDRWVEQGVLLLNTVLTVEQGLPASHAQWGWEVWTDQVITAVAQAEQPVVFMLWGAHAQAKHKLIDAASGPQGIAPRHLVLQANHPSPLSALRGPHPFIGCGHFSTANAFLQTHTLAPIKW
jgi:uracil-DNA glycosylase